MATSERSPPKKKTKRLKKYRSKWENDYYWLKCVSDNVYKANCTVCRRVFSIGHGGVGDIKQHGSGENHRKCERLSRTKERPLTTNREHIGGPSTSASETGMLSKSVGSQTLLSGEMSDSLRGAFMAQLTSTMNTLLKTAVCEIAKIFENSLCDHQMELLLKGQESQLENPVLTLEEQGVDEQERDEMKIYDAASLTSESAPCVLNSPEINFEGPIDWCAPLSSDDTAESSQTRPDIVEYPGVPQRSLSVSLWRIPTIKKEVEADFETHLRKALDNCLGEGSSPAKLNDSLECSQDLSSPLPATKRRGPGRPRKSVTQLAQTIRREEPVLQVRRDDKQELSLTEHGNNLSENHDNNKTLPVTEFNSVQDDKAKKHMNDTCKRNTCKFCHKVFNTEFGLKVHVRSHKKCPGCHKTFPFPSTLRVHMKSCSEIKKARTLLKTKSINLQKQKHKFGTKHVPTLIIRKHSSTRKNTAAPHSSNSTLSETSNSSKKGKQYSCTNCHMIFSSRSALQDHNRCHTLEEPYACTICQQKFHKKNLLKVHILKLHKDHKYSVAKAALTSPFIKSTGNQVDSNLTSKDKSPVAKHTVVEQAIRKRKNHVVWETMGRQVPQGFLCFLCEKILSTKYLLIKHFNIHTGEKPFSCERCGGTFRCQGDKNRHKKKCFISPLISCRKCRMEFPNKIAYQNHVFHTHKDRPNLCQLCGKGFYSIRHLSNHYEHVHV